MARLSIAGHVWRILGRGAKRSPPIHEQPRKSPSWIRLRVNRKKWSNTLKQFVGNLLTNCLSVLDHFVKLALKGLNNIENRKLTPLLPYLEFQETADLVIFIEEILNWNFFFVQCPNVGFEPKYPNYIIEKQRKRC